MKRTSYNVVETLVDMFNDKYSEDLWIEDSTPGKFRLVMDAGEVAGLHPAQMRQIIKVLDNVYDRFESKFDEDLDGLRAEINGLKNELAGLKNINAQLTARCGVLSNVLNEGHMFSILDDNNEHACYIVMGWVCDIVNASFQWPEYIKINPVDGAMFNDVYAQFCNHKAMVPVTDVWPMQNVKDVVRHRYIPIVRMAMTLLRPFGPPKCVTL